ncbi:FlgB family protein [uncultured Roseovarius sp.]|uniref:FlgB family protein n=1 Tax=Roseovarius sp. BRH_c41 TaxID=1629709 RepID=UPI00342A0872
MSCLIIERSNHVLKTISKGIRVKPWLKPIEGEAPMFEKLEIFRMAHAMARHAGARQAVVSQNMANADTPHYAARDIVAFAESYETDKPTHVSRATRNGHLLGQDHRLGFDVVEDPTAIKDPNGNSVSLETEMLRAVDVKRQHDRALAIYKSSLTVLRTAIGRR